MLSDVDGSAPRIISDVKQWNSDRCRVVACLVASMCDSKKNIVLSWSCGNVRHTAMVVIVGMVAATV